MPRPPEPQGPHAPCLGAPDQADDILDDPHLLRVHGRLLHPRSGVVVLRGFLEGKHHGDRPMRGVEGLLRALHGQGPLGHRLGHGRQGRVRVPHRADGRRGQHDRRAHLLDHDLGAAVRDNLRALRIPHCAQQVHRSGGHRDGERPVLRKERGRRRPRLGREPLGACAARLGQGGRLRPRGARDHRQGDGRIEEDSPRGGSRTAGIALRLPPGGRTRHAARTGRLAEEDRQAVVRAGSREEDQRLQRLLVLLLLQEGYYPVTECAKVQLRVRALRRSCRRGTSPFNRIGLRV
mmetsp:Transcript_31141/g.86950  ORF Transcript_31141/g.86950 Transcript_31141/m.86950 type:complete len:292 (-) Transcript_31141:127-1002(-)